jgi:hypothetical protein
VTTNVVRRFMIPVPPDCFCIKSALAEAVRRRSGIADVGR